MRNRRIDAETSDRGGVPGQLRGRRGGIGDSHMTGTPLWRCQAHGCSNPMLPKGATCQDHIDTRCSCGRKIYRAGICCACYRARTKRPCASPNCSKQQYGASRFCRCCLAATRHPASISNTPAPPTVTPSIPGFDAEATQRLVETPPDDETHGWTSDNDCALWANTRCPECDRLISCHARLCTLWIRALRAPGVTRNAGGAHPYFSRMSQAAYHDHMFSVVGRDL